MTEAPPSRAALLSGAKALVVEDEIMVSMLIEQMLYDLGVESVRIASRVDEALAAIEAESPDFAALDVNLRGEQAFPIAAALAARGAPFVFVTGYGAGGLAPPWADRPVLQKPFAFESLAECVALAIGKT